MIKHTKLDQSIVDLLPTHLTQYESESGTVMRLGGDWYLFEVGEDPPMSSVVVPSLPAVDPTPHRVAKIDFFSRARVEESKAEEFEYEVTKSVLCAQAAVDMLNRSVWMSSTRIANRIIGDGYDVTPSDVRMALFHLTTTGVVERFKKKTPDAKQKIYHYRLK